MKALLSARVRALCRPYLWQRHRWRCCGPNHFWSSYSCSVLCHWQSSWWWSVCCSVNEQDDWNRTAPPSPPLMRSIDEDHQVSIAARRDPWQKQRGTVSAKPRTFFPPLLSVLVWGVEFWRYRWYRWLPSLEYNGTRWHSWTGGLCLWQHVM